MFSGLVYFLDDLLLNDGDFLIGNLHAHVTTGDHDPVRYVDDLIDIANALFIFYLGDNLDISAAIFLKQSAELQDIFFLLDERGGDEKGVLQGSEFFFFTPTEIFESYYYYILVCGHFFCNENYAIRRDSHLGPLILLINEGELYVEYEGERKTACKNDLVLLNCDKPHAYYAGKHCEFHFLHIGGKNCREITDNLIQTNHGFLFKLQNYREIRDIMEPLIYEIHF